MKTKKLLTGFIALAVVVSLFNVGFMVKDCYFDNIEQLPKGEFLYSSMSPDGETTVSIYRVTGMDKSAIRGAVVSIGDNGERTERNVFWQIGADNAMAGWVDNSTININDCVVNVLDNSVYDSRYEKPALEGID